MQTSCHQNPITYLGFFCLLDMIWHSGRTSWILLLLVNVIVPNCQILNILKIQPLVFVILLIVWYLLVSWQVNLFIPFYNYIVHSLFIFNYTTSCSNRNPTFSTCGILDFCNLHYNPIYGILSLRPLLCNGSRFNCAPPYKGKW
jgi:hypothetical protein